MKINVFITLLCALLFTQQLSANLSNCKQTDSLVLVSFYEKIESGLDWDFTQPLTTWHGVSLNQNGCVSSLILDSLFLMGTLTPEIGLLCELDTLNLDRNLLSGEIPASIGDLKSLSYLSLNKNDFNGTIPKDIGNLSNLKHLSIDGTSLTGLIPYSLGELYNLQHLSLGSNYLTGNIPSSLGNLQSLNFLNLCENRLTGLIPASLGNLHNLKELYLMENSLDGCYFEELKSLCSILIFWEFINDDDDDGHADFYNNFDTSWSSFCESDAGVCIPYSPCRLKDSLTLGKLYENITSLNWNTNLPINEWEGVYLNGDGCVDAIYIDDQTVTNALLIPEIGDFEELKSLYLNCNLTGEIPNEIFSLANLELLNLSGNNLTGEIPLGIDGLVNLKAVNFSDNNLSGCYPYELQKFCDSSNSLNAFTNNNFDATWEDFCAFSFGTCCSYTKMDIVWDSNTPLIENFYAAERAIEITNYNTHVIVLNNNSTTTLLAGEYILIDGNFQVNSQSDLILSIDSCR